MNRLPAFLFLAAITGTAALHAQVRETPAVLGLVEGGNPQGYIQNSNEQGVFFSTAPGGQGQLVPYNRIRGEGLDKLIRFDDRNEMLGAPRALFTAGQYIEAAEAFGKVARDFQFILSVPQNFATEALFYQIESLKRAGQYAAMAPIVNSPVAATIPTKLVEAYKRPFEFHKLWALFGQNDIAGLKTALEAYQEPVTGDLKLLPAPNFKTLPPVELAQLSFLRAKVYEAAGEKSKALDDYYRTFTLAYGNDVLLAKLAMGAAMVIQRQDPALAKESRSALTQMQSIAYLFSKRFGKDTMPAEFQAYAVMPVLPKPKAEEPEAGGKPAETPAPEGDAKAKGPAPAPADAKAKGDGKGEDAKAKGDAKGGDAKGKGKAK